MWFRRVPTSAIIVFERQLCQAPFPGGLPAGEEFSCVILILLIAAELLKQPKGLPIAL